MGLPCSVNYILANQGMSVHLESSRAGTTFNVLMKPTLSQSRVDEKTQSMDQPINDIESL